MNAEEIKYYLKRQCSRATCHFLSVDELGKLEVKEYPTYVICSTRLEKSEAHNVLFSFTKHKHHGIFVHFYDCRGQLPVDYGMALPFFTINVFKKKVCEEERLSGLYSLLMVMYLLQNTTIRRLMAAFSKPPQQNDLRVKKFYSSLKRKVSLGN